MISAMSSEEEREKRQMNAYRAEVEALVRRVVPDEIDNVDDIMVQFSGREEELIETLRAMQEKSIAQRARAAVQRSAKKEAGRTGRMIDDESSGDPGQSYTTDGSQSRTTDGQSHTTGRSSRSGAEDSITEQFTAGDDDYSSSTGSSRSGSSYTSDSRSDNSEFSDSQLEGSIGVISIERGSHGGDDKVKTSPGLSEAIDASDWRAVGAAAEHLQGDGVSSSQPSNMTGMSSDTRDELDDMIDQGDWSGIINKASNMQSGHVQRNMSDEELD